VCSSANRPPSPGIDTSPPALRMVGRDPCEWATAVLQQLVGAGLDLETDQAHFVIVAEALKPPCPRHFFLGCRVIVPNWAAALMSPGHAGALSNPASVELHLSFTFPRTLLASMKTSPRRRVQIGVTAVRFLFLLILQPEKSKQREERGRHPSTEKTAGASGCKALLRSRMGDFPTRGPWQRQASGKACEPRSCKVSRALVSPFGL